MLKNPIFLHGTGKSDTFAVQKDDRHSYLAEQAVNLLKSYLGYFYARIIRYRRLPIRKLLDALRGRLSTFCSVYGSRFSAAKVKLLNAESMNELIAITEKDGKQVVSARELYERLGFAPQHWANWYKKNITNNPFAVENEDFVELPLSGRTLDFALSIDFAKRLAMMARTETGEQIRNYFIEIEKRASKPMSQLEILAQSVQILQAQEKRIAEIDGRVKVIEAKQTTHQN